MRSLALLLLFVPVENADEILALLLERLPNLREQESANASQDYAYPS